jgi:hypothetical protein
VAQPPQSVVEFLGRNGLTERRVLERGHIHGMVGPQGHCKTGHIGPGRQAIIIPFEWFSARQWYNAGRARFLIYQDPESWNMNLGANLERYQNLGRPNHTMLVDGYRTL